MPDFVEDFLTAFVTWAATSLVIDAVALVGSHARGEAREDSDVDLLILGHAHTLLADAAWSQRFGDVRQLAVEDYGAVTSLRVHYASGLEVEYGIAASSWAELPLDPGSAKVVAGGIHVLHDPQGLFNPLL